MQLSVDYENEALQLEPSINSDITMEAYDDLAGSRTPSVGVEYKNGKTSYIVKGRSIDLRYRGSEGQLLNLKPVGLVQCVAATENCLYGTCQHGGMEYDVKRGTCFRISETDPRLMKHEVNVLIKEGQGVLRVRWELRRVATDVCTHMISALTNQQVDTDALRKGFASVGAEVKLKVFRNTIGGFGANGCDLQLMDLLFDSAQPASRDKVES